MRGKTLTVTPNPTPTITPTVILTFGKKRRNLTLKYRFALFFLVPLHPLTRNARLKRRKNQTSID